MSSTSGQSADANRLALGPERDPNNQQRKLDFAAQHDRSDIYNPHGLQTPLSPCQVMAGSMITGINSDLPGLVTAQVTENVYNIVTGRILLILQGARLIRASDSVVAYGRAGRCWCGNASCFPTAVRSRSTSSPLGNLSST